jgi:hypothetical protein
VSFSAKNTAQQVADFLAILNNEINKLKQMTAIAA